MVYMNHSLEPKPWFVFPNYKTNQSFELFACFGFLYAQLFCLQKQLYHRDIIMAVSTVCQFRCQSWQPYLRFLCHGLAWCPKEQKKRRQVLSQTALKTSHAIWLIGGNIIPAASNAHGKPSGKKRVQERTDNSVSIRSLKSRWVFSPWKSQ